MLSSDSRFNPPIKMLETARLSIRVDTLEDYVRAFRTKTDGQLKKYFGIANESLLQVQKDKVRGGLSTYRTSVVFFHFTERNLDTVVGSAAFHNWYPGHRRSEIGYAMGAEAYQGKGYMTEAIVPIVAFGFEVMLLNRIEAFIHPDNIASKRLVERAGFQHEGQLLEHIYHDGVVGDSLVYGLLRKQFSSETG